MLEKMYRRSWVIWCQIFMFILYGVLRQVFANTLYLMWRKVVLIYHIMATVGFKGEWLVWIWWFLVSPYTIDITVGRRFISRTYSVLQFALYWWYRPSHHHQHFKVCYTFSGGTGLDYWIFDGFMVFGDWVWYHTLMLRSDGLRFSFVTRWCLVAAYSYRTLFRFTIALMRFRFLELAQWVLW